MNSSDEEKAAAPPMRPKAKKASAKAGAKKPAVRTIGTNKYGAEEAKPQTDRRPVLRYEAVRGQETEEEPAFAVSSKAVKMSPSLILGVRLDPRQVLEYLHLINPEIVPDPKFPTDPETTKVRVQPWKYSWKGAEELDRVYGTEIPKTETLMRLFLQVVSTELGLSMIADTYGYIYIGYMPQVYASQDGYRGYLQYPYKEMHKLDVKQMETLQRIIYRIPIRDKLNSTESKQLEDLRMGGLGKYPDYFLVFDMAAVTGYVYLEQ